MSGFDRNDGFEHLPTMTDTNPPAPEIPAELAAALADRYELQSLLGEGGMASVYRARDLKHDRWVAMKVLHAEVVKRIGGERFLDEIRTTANLTHPHILGLIDSGEANGFLYYVTPFIAGGSLRTRMDREHQLPLDEVVRITTAVAAGLDHAHRQGVIHRDIKPENILMQDGEPVLADFGIALAVRHGLEQRRTDSGFTLGTPQYMSPEQASGDRELDPRSDQFALASIVYEMLTGDAPHTGNSAAAIFAKLVSERPLRVSALRHTVPPAMEAAVLRALSKAPADRFPSCSAFAEALAKPGTAPPERSRLPRHASAVGVLVVTAVLAFALVSRLTRPPPPPPVPHQVTFSGQAEAVRMTSDGEMLAYLANGRHALMVQDVNQLDAVTLVQSRVGLGPPEWSRDGTTILFSAVLDSIPGLYAVSRLGGTPRRVGGAVGLRAGQPRLGPGAPAFQLGGAYTFVGSTERLAVAVGRGRIRVGPEFAAEPGSSIQPPSAAPREERLQPPIPDNVLILTVYPEVSAITELVSAPDGSALAFIGLTTDGAVRLGVIPVRRDAQATLLSLDDGSGTETAPPASVRWPEPGDAIYVTRASGPGANLFRLRRRRGSWSPPEPVLFGLPPNGSADLAPAARRATYAGGSSRTHLEIVPLTAGAPTTHFSEGTWEYRRPVMAPAGSTMAYLKGTAGTFDVFITDLSSGEERRITASGAALPILAWSPDGHQLAYLEQRAAAPELRIFDVTSNLTRDVTIGTMIMRAGNLHWSSPTEIAYLTPLDDDVPFGPDIRTGIWTVLDINTGDEHPLAELSTRERVLNPVFAPEGEAFAALVLQEGFEGPGLAVVTASGIERRLVDGFVMPLAWTSDNRVLYSPLGPGTIQRHVFAVPVRGGAPKMVRELPEACRTDISVSADGRIGVCATLETESDVWVVDPFEPIN